MTRRLMLVVAEDSYLWSHRIGLAVAARDAGYDVTIVTRVGEYGERIRALGFDLVDVDFARGRISPRANLRTVRELCAVYRRWEPQLVHHVAIKPIVLGSAAAARARVPVTVNALAGLGTALTSSHVKARLARPVLRPALGWAMRRPRSHAMVQNPENAKFVESLGVRPERVSLVRGAGVDVRRFQPRPEPAGPVRVTMVSRLLWDKGVREFVDAAMLVRKARGDVLFTLVGAPDEGNPTSVPPEEVRSWAADGLVEWWGYREDVAEVLAGSHVAVLPSYGEGTAEDAARGRGLRAADCRDRCRGVPGGVRHGDNGLLVPPATPLRSRMRSWRSLATPPAAPRWGPRAGGGPKRSSPPSASTRKPSGLRTRARDHREMRDPGGRRGSAGTRPELPPRRALAGGVVLRNALRSPLAFRAWRLRRRRRGKATVPSCTTPPIRTCSPIHGWSRICCEDSLPQAGATRSTSRRSRSCPRSS